MKLAASISPWVDFPPNCKIQWQKTSDSGGVVQSLSCVCLFVSPWTAACQASLSFIISQSLLRFTAIELMMPSNHLILRCPLFLPPLVFASIRAFSDDSGLCIRWPKYWNFSFGISPFNEHSGLISFRIDWLDVLAIQGTLKSLPQQHSCKASIFQCSVFFMVQLHTYCSLLQARSCRRRLGYSENPHN